MTRVFSAVFGNLPADVRMAARQLRRSPLFALTIVATFALGIAANAAVFSVMDALVLRPLAVPQVDRVVAVAEQRGGGYPSAVSFADYRDYAQNTHAFDELGARTQRYLTLTRSGQSEHAQATLATTNLFRLFRIKPLLGRTFATGEDEPGRDGEAVLTHAFWQSHFGSRADAIGQAVVLDGKPYTVIGVMPQSFDHVGFTDLWLPLALTPTQGNDRTTRDYTVTGRLRSGVTLAAASGELNAVAAGLARRFPESNADRKVLVRPLIASINGDLTPTFTEIILAATLLLMLVVCANISNLQFARTMRRAPEMAIRAALGSSRPRLLRQLLVESLLQSLLGACAGLLLARVWLHFMLAEMPASVARFLAGWSDVHLSGGVLAYSVAVALAAGLISGLAPAIAGMRVDLLAQLKLGGGRGMSGGARSGRLRNLFAGAQVMLATALIAGSACLAASMYTMLHAAGRFAPGQVLLLTTYLPSAQYPSAVSQSAWTRESLDKLRALPGVRSADFTTALPYNNQGVRWQELRIVGDPVLPGESRSTQRLTVSPGFLRNFGIGHSSRAISLGQRRVQPAACRGR